MKLQKGYDQLAKYKDVATEISRMRPLKMTSL